MIVFIISWLISLAIVAWAWVLLRRARREAAEWERKFEINAQEFEAATKPARQDIQQPLT